MLPSINKVDYYYYYYYYYNNKGKLSDREFRDINIVALISNNA